MYSIEACLPWYTPRYRGLCDYNTVFDFSFVNFQVLLKLFPYKSFISAEVWKTIQYYVINKFKFYKRFYN